MKQETKAVENIAKRRVWFILNVILTCIYLIWRLFFTIPIEYGAVSTVAGIALFVVEFLGMFEALVHYFNMSDTSVKELPEISREMYPDVDVFISTYNEPEDLLFKTVNGCKHLKYPDKSKIHIYLCDDGHREEMRMLAHCMGVNYLDREDHNGAKAGNLNHALEMTESPYILTLDADMIPHSMLLMHTIPYFIEIEMENEGKEERERKHMGFVQTPQAFYNPDLFQYNLYSEARIPNEQDYFYRDIQVSRNKSNSVIYGGSNTVLSRKALEDIGGFYTGTITEDYATGILMQKKGYICYATDEVLASGLSPTDLKSLVNQRIRWARGVIQTNRKMHVFLSKNLKFTQKVNYWASEWYWYAPVKRLIYFMSPILYATFGYMVIKCTLLQILIFWLPMYITSNISLRMLSRNVRTTKWTSIYETVLFPFLLGPVLLETIGISMKQFKVTKKGVAENEAGKNLIYLIPFALLVVLSVIGVLNCVHMIFESNNIGPVFVLFWLLINLFTLVMAMFFIAGRKPLRKSERASVILDCDMIAGGRTYSCKTDNISEQGVAVILNQPININDKETVEMKLDDGRYEACIQARVVHVSNRKDKWKYAFQITDYCDTYEEYLQLIYDRVPTLPQKLNKADGSFDDLRINLKGRVTKPFYENRRYARVEIGVDIRDTEGSRWKMIDFNYRYCTLAGGEEMPQPQEMVLVVDKKKQIFLSCRKENQKIPGRVLYEIVNYEENYRDLEKREFLDEWVKKNWEAAREAELENRKSKRAETKKQSKDFNEMDYI